LTSFDLALFAPPPHQKKFVHSGQRRIGAACSGLLAYDYGELAVGGAKSPNPGQDTSLDGTDGSARINSAPNVDAG